MTTPWIEALALPEKDQKLEVLLRVAPRPVRDVHHFGIRDAVKHLKAEIERSYRPSAQDMKVIREIVDIARGYAGVAYASEDQFVAGAMGRLPSVKSNPAVMLTGYSGGGKSRLLEAIGRVFSVQRIVQPSPSLQPFPIRPFALVTFERDVTAVRMMNQLSYAIGGDAEYTAKGGADLRHARLRTYQVGCCSALLDETQFMSRSEGSSALPAKLLGQATGLGPPVIYACNFILGHKLKRRPPEDQRRLLSAPIILVPDESNDPAFIGFLSDIKVVMDGVLLIDPAVDADEIHAMSFGLRGPILDLILTAYRIAREAKKPSATLAVTMENLRSAYLHVDYEHHRNAVTIYQNDALGFDNTPLAYKCPFELPASVQVKVRAHADRIRQRKVDDAVFEESRTHAEREAEKAAEKARKKAADGLASISGIAPPALAPSRARRQRITADDLRANL